jgi:hypothetical protein
LADEPLTEDDGELCLDLEPFARPAFPFLSSISRTSRRRGSPSRSRGGSGHRAAAALERAARDLGVQLYYHAIDSQRIPDAATVRGFDALEDVLFVGYPSGVWDQVNLMPILRRGTTATPLELEFEGAQAIPDRRRRVSRIERQPGIRGAGRSAPSTGRRGAHHLVRWGHSGGVFPRRGQPAPGPVPAQTQAQSIGAEMIDLGLVIKSESVRELIDAYVHKWLSH